MTELHPASLAGLVRSVALLALPAQDQIAWLSSLGLGEPLYCDELAMELGDGALLARQFEEAGWLKPEARRMIVELDLVLDGWSGPAHEEFWRVDALAHSPDWVHIRASALQALIAL